MGCANPTLDHFLSPRNVGDVPDPDGVGEARQPQGGATTRVTIRVRRGRVERVGFRTFGCPHAIAAASALTELAAGLAADEAAGLSEENISRALGGIPTERLYCAELAVAALRMALDSAQRAGAVLRAEVRPTPTPSAAVPHRTAAPRTPGGLP